MKEYYNFISAPLEGEVSEGQRGVIKFLENLKKENKISDYKIQKKSLIKKVCKKPFFSISIKENGEISTCCNDFMKDNIIGNLKNNGLEEIWNGEKIQNIRKKLLSGDYSMCNTELCRDKSEIDGLILSEKCPPPKNILFDYDRECNLRCITCRDKPEKNTEEDIKFFQEKIDKQLPYLLENASEIAVSGAGEAFYSRYSRGLIKKIAAENKHIRWFIKTNGLLFNTAACRELGIYGKINTVFISLPAMDKDVYARIMRGSDYDTVIKNIKEAAAERTYKKTIKQIIINSVISNLNYKEMPALAEFSCENDIKLIITQYNWWGNTEFGRNYKETAVWENFHPEFKEFKKILKHPALDYKNILFTPRFKEIREQA